ncbi:MAG: hypothetical protein ABIN67_22205 [Ferruginibacter sp.]
MPDNLNINNPNPTEFFGKRNQVDDKPLQPGKTNIQIPGDPLEIDKGEEDIDRIGDDVPGLGNSYEKPHKPTTPSAEYDGIRDGDRQAFDEIPGGEEDDFPRTNR